MSFDKRLGFRRLYNIQKVLPAVYDDSLSYYELLTKIQCKIEEIINYYNQLAEYQDVQDKALKDAYDELVHYVDVNIAELKQLVELLTEGSLDWDVQHGFYVDSQDAMRDMFNDVTVHSYTIEELDNVFDSLDMNVDGLTNCGLSVKGLAVYSHLLTKPDKLGQQLTPESGQAQGNLSVSDLINTSIDESGYLYVN